MFARVVTTHLKPEKVDAAVALWREKLLPMIEGMDGLKGAYLMGDRTSGYGLTITLWETRENAEILAASFAQNIAHFAELMTDEPSVAEYEVMLSI